MLCGISFMLGFSPEIASMHVCHKIGLFKAHFYGNMSPQKCVLEQGLLFDSSLTPSRLILNRDL